MNKREINKKFDTGSLHQNIRTLMNKGYLGHYIQVHHMINNLFRCEKTGKTLFVKDNEVLESKVDEAKAKKSSHQKEYFQLSHNSKVRYPEIELDTVDDNSAKA